MKIVKIVGVACVLGLASILGFQFIGANDNIAPTGPPPSVYPFEFSEDCAGQEEKYFNHCADQWTVFREAFSAAKDAEKILLIVYGTADCAECVALIDLLLNDEGELGIFTHETYVILALASERATNATDILININAHHFYNFDDPFVFIVDAEMYFDGAISIDGGFPPPTENPDDWIDKQALLDALVVRHAVATL
jgi:hypothetical protein